MKKLNIKVLSLFVAAAGMFASCSQEEITKAEVDNATYPNTELAISEITLGNVGSTTAELSFDVQGYVPGVLEIAVVYSTTPDFASSNIAVFNDSVAGETVNFLVKGLSMETTYYAYAYAYMRGGSAVSDTISFATTAEPISKEMLNGKAYGATGVVDGFGEASYDFSFTLQTTESDTVWVCDLDPYFAGYGYVSSVGYNILGGILTIAEDGKTATIECWDGQFFGYQDTYWSASTNGGDSVPFIIDIVNNGANLQIGTFFGVRVAGGWYSVFPPTEFGAL